MVEICCRLKKIQSDKSLVQHGTLNLAITSGTKFPWSKSADLGVADAETVSLRKAKWQNLLGVTRRSDFTALGVVHINRKEPTLNFQNKAYINMHERKLYDAEP